MPQHILGTKLAETIFQPDEAHESTCASTAAWEKEVAPLAAVIKNKKMAGVRPTRFSFVRTPLGTFLPPKQR